MGTKTMQMERVETKAGTAICSAPSRMAVRRPCPFEVAIDVLDFDRGIVDEDADREGHSSRAS